MVPEADSNVILYAELLPSQQILNNYKYISMLRGSMPK